MIKRNRVRKLTVLFVSALWAAAAVEAQTTWYVDDDAPNDPGPGDPSISDPLEDGSADHPFGAIQEGIGAADPNDTVLVLDGTYTGQGNKNLDFCGKPITVRSANGPETCIINCESFGRGFCFHSGEDEFSILQGFTIRNAFTVGGGAGVHCVNNSNPTITDCTIAHNTANSWGGGIYCDDCDLMIINCTITENMGGGAAAASPAAASPAAGRLG